MSLRSMAGILFICAVIGVPWLVSDWLPEANQESGAGNNPFVPGLGEDRRKKRQFSEIRIRRPRPVNSSSKRAASKGVVKSVATGARALTGRQQRGIIPESKVSLAAVARHSTRISREMNGLGLRLGDPVFCRIFKEENELELWVQPEGRQEFSLFRVYRICKRSGGPGPKTREGDRQAPEGFYFVTPGRMVAETRYHLGFDIGYPNLLDHSRGRTGDDVLVHGKCVSNSSFALTDGAIEEVFTIAAAALKNGQPFFRVHCFPFRMDDKRMDPQIGKYPAYDTFWANLKEGYDFFEILRFPPNVTAGSDGTYTFSVK